MLKNEPRKYVISKSVFFVISYACAYSVCSCIQCAKHVHLCVFVYRGMGEVKRDAPPSWLSFTLCTYSPFLRHHMVSLPLFIPSLPHHTHTHSISHSELCCYPQSRTPWLKREESQLVQASLLWTSLVLFQVISSSLLFSITLAGSETALGICRGLRWVLKQLNDTSVLAPLKHWHVSGRHMEMECCIFWL